MDLALALHHQPQRHRLDAAGRERLAHGAAEQRADLVAHQPVEDAAGLLGVDQVAVQVARVGSASATASDLVTW
jgi:hypothetical protein